MREKVSSAERTVPRLSVFRRALWHANRTSLKWAIKSALSIVHARDKQARRLAARAYVPDESTLATAADLRSNGYAMVDKFVDPVLLSELEQASLERVSRAEQLQKSQSMTHKSFWVRLLDQDRHDGAFDCDNVFVRFATQPGIVTLLSAYLKEVPRLTDVLLTYSLPSSAQESYSQLWHRDFDDVRTLKVFAYLTDVNDTDDGPFTFLPGPASDPIGFTLRSHLRDEALFSRVAREDVREMCGARLTTFVCETSRSMHMGSRLRSGHSRLMYTATFISAPSVYPPGNTRFSASRTLSGTERLLLAL